MHRDRHCTMQSVHTRMMDLVIHVTWLQVHLATCAPRNVRIVPITRMLRNSTLGIPIQTKPKPKSYSRPWCVWVNQFIFVSGKYGIIWFAQNISQSVSNGARITLRLAFRRKAA